MKAYIGNMQESEGKKGAIIIPMSLCEKIETAIEKNTIESDLIEEHTVLTKFHITKKTLQNSLKRLRGFYTTAFNGSRWWYLSKLLGLNNIVSRRKKAA
jgi:hypothetical protein